MEDVNKQKYIRILKLDHTLSSTQRYTRSLEKYLEKNNRSFNIVDGDYIVYVNDKNEALRMSFDLVKYKIEYFDGVELLLMDTKPDGKKGGRPINTVIDNSSGTTMTPNQFYRKSKQDTKLNYLTRSEVIKKKLLTTGGIDKAVAAGGLSFIAIGGRKYIERQELFDYLKANM